MIYPRSPWGLRNNSSANAAYRGVHLPAPTLYFGARSNYCAWERDPEICQECGNDLVAEGFRYCTECLTNQKDLSS